MATHSSILAWRIPWTEEPGQLLCPQGHKELDMTETTQHVCTQGDKTDQGLPEVRSDRRQECDLDCGDGNQITCICQS